MLKPDQNYELNIALINNQLKLAKEMKKEFLKIKNIKNR
jgi:hypothetical protein